MVNDDLEHNEQHKKDKYNLFHDGAKQGTKAQDGSGITVVFYDTSEEHIAKGTEKGKILSTSKADGALKQVFKESCEEIEKDIKVKFIDINNISAEEKEFLIRAKIKIPDTPDIVVGYGKFKDKYIGGNGDYPKDGIEYLIVSDTYKNEEINDSFRHTSLHELGHIMGLQHTHQAEHYPSNRDNRENSIMSYNGEYRTTLGDVDKYSLGEAYELSEDSDFKFKKRNLVKNSDSGSIEGSKANDDTSLCLEKVDGVLNEARMSFISNGISHIPLNEEDYVKDKKSLAKGDAVIKNDIFEKC
jgi:hypothetical protein